ncbi:MAG: helix-turn-helix transcriptional regulator [Acidobacteria bacterium]|nr:helix-turn-helix transcriptional regulator [Acidobacteriota bacterium]MBV9475701.1 helix-turn-helix transcriptional regulator [Acidobacteriota bacterium]
MPFLESTWRAGERLVPHAHASAHLVVVLEGAFDETCGRRTRNCDAATVILRAAEETHADRFLAPTRYVALEVDTPPPSTRLGTTALVPRLARELRRNDSVSQALAHGVLLQILGELLHPDGAAHDARVREARALLASRFDEPLRISDIAAAVELHPATLTRAFRAAYGCNPIEFLLATRVQRARRAILRGESLADVALACGFYDQSHLSNAFRRCTGMTPRAYRRARVFSKN